MSTWPASKKCSYCQETGRPSHCGMCAARNTIDNLEFEWDRLVAFFDNLKGHWYTGDSRYPGEKERMMFSASVVQHVVRRFRERARARL